MSTEGDDEVTEPPAKPGAPNLSLAGLKIWIHGRQFPDTTDFWDGNWLQVTAQCCGSGASVSATGPIIHLSELYGWMVGSEELLKNLKGEANLACIEPNLLVSLKSGSLGHITMDVSITPDHLSQRHWFRFEIDQSYLAPFVDQCQSVKEAHPLKARPDG